MVKLVNVNKFFGDLHVLKDINLQVAEGEKLVIIGPSGSGKSTTVRCMNFLEEPTSGQVYIDGVQLTHKNKTELVRRSTAMVFQQFNLYRSTHQMIKGVMTFVVYYGQKKWSAPRAYEDMMKPIPPVFKNYMNVASYPLIEMRYLDPERFHTQELKELITGLKYLYNHQYDETHDITVSHEIAISLAALTKNTQIYFPFII